MGDNPEQFLVSSQGQAELILAVVDATSELCCLKLLVALEWVMSMFCDSVSCSGEEKTLVPNILGQVGLVVGTHWGMDLVQRIFLSPVLLQVLFHVLNTHMTARFGFLAVLGFVSQVLLLSHCDFGCFLKCGRQGYLERCVCVWC